MEGPRGSRYMNRAGWVKLAGFLALVVLIILVPLVIESKYYVHVAIVAALSIIFAVGVRALINTGLLSFGQQAYYAIGAYVSATLVMQFGLNFWLALPAAGAVAAVVALMFGYPALRVKGAYFICATFALAEIVRLFFSQFFRPLFGGLTGITEIPKPDPLGIPGLFTVEFTSLTPFYYLAMVLMGLCVLVFWRLDRSRFSRINLAIKETDVLCESVGVNILRHKMITFGLACFFVGMGGSFYAHYYSTISPECFSFLVGAYAVIYPVVGGVGYIIGAIIGGSFLTVVAEVLRAFGPYEVLAFGITLTVVILFLPDGLISLPRRLSAALKRYSRGVRYGTS